MAVQIGSLFNAKSKSIGGLLTDHGFEIPAYQRTYRWSPGDIRRLFDDCLVGLNRLPGEHEAVAFIGAVITVNMENPSGSHGEPPPEPRHIIDGQQRTTTLLLAVVALHRLLAAKPLAEIEIDNSGDYGATPDEVASYIAWLDERIAEAKAQLVNCLVHHKPFGDGTYQNLPRLVRQTVDFWDTHEDQAKYLSPAAHIIHSYVASLAPGGISFEPAPPDQVSLPESTGSSFGDHQLLIKRFGQVADYVRQVARGSTAELDEKVDLDELLVTGSQALNGLFGTSELQLTRVVRRLSARNALFAEVVRALLFARFLLDRVAVTHINAKDESYAFDLFDSLNTTGEPLTAFETFRPLVVSKEGDGYQGSQLERNMDTVSTLLAQQDVNVQRDTGRLLTAFLLADAGIRAPLKHNEQRRILGRRYNAAETLEDRTAMTRLMSDTGLSYFPLWHKQLLSLDTPGHPPEPLDDVAAFCLAFLKSIDHTVVLGVLTRYFAAYRANSDDPDRLKDLSEAVRAVTAFSVLWRVVHGGTDGIDGKYRSLLADGLGPDPKGFARTPKDSHDTRQLPPVEELQLALWGALTQGSNVKFETKSKWIELGHRKALYQQSSSLARFLLLVAGHHAVPAGGSVWRTKPGMHADHTDMLKPERWADERLATVEHIAPQSLPQDHGEPAAWAPQLYLDSSVVQRLGNLTLIPLDRNASLGNRPWSEKAALYAVMAASSPDDASIAMEAVDSAHISVGTDLRERLLEDRMDLPLLRAVAAYEGDWTPQLVDERTKFMLGLVWDQLAPWLGHD